MLRKTLYFFILLSLIAACRTGDQNRDTSLAIPDSILNEGLEISEEVINEVDFVVNYDLPDQAENYVHRVGRTGRGTHKGHAFSYCSEEEKEMLVEIEEFLGNPIEELRISKNDYEETLDYTDDTDNNWKAVMEKAEIENAEYLKKKKKRNKRKN